MAQARAILKWCNAHPHGGTVQTAKGEIELLSTEVAERRAAALAIIETHGPEHIAFLRSSKGRTRIHATVPDSVADYLKREAARAGISKAACIRAIIANAAARNCLP